MKLTQLDLTSFRSYRGVSLDLKAPRILVAGLNGTGKTSVKESLRWLLTGHCEGTDGKGAGAEVLIPMGQKIAEVQATIEGIGRVNRQYTTVGGGSFNVEGFKGSSQIQHAALFGKLNTTPEFLDACLDSDLFLDLGHADAKAMVLSLLGVKITIPTIPQPGVLHLSVRSDSDTVGKREFTEYTLDQLDALYRQAFEDRKAAKRALQQHTLGPKPVAQQMPALEAIEGQLGKLRTLLGEQRQAVGSILGQREALSKEADRLTVTLNTKVPEDPSDEIARVEQELAALVAPVQGPPPAAGDPQRLHFLKSQEEAIHEFVSRGALALCVFDRVPCYTAASSFTHRLLEIRDEIKTLESSTAPIPEDRQTILQRRLTALMWNQSLREANFRDVKAANQRRQEIRQELDALQNTAQQEEEIAKTQARIATGEKLLHDARNHFQAQAAYTKAEQQHASLKADVDRLEALVEQLGPKGVRVEALAKAIQTFEAAVNPYVKPFGWTITFDVEPWQVSANGRPVETYSRSERYRIGIALQLGIAQLSGLNFCIVDEIDLLDAANRSAITTMLLSAPLEQILILGTRETAQALPKVKGVLCYRLSKEGDQSVIAERGAA